MEKQILTDPLVKPENDVLKNVLGRDFDLYEEFARKTSGLGLTPEWNYYRDGKSWLCKLLNKKKNMCWVSVWNTGFKLTFYFTEKTIDALRDLEISDSIKKAALETKPAGKLIPVILLVETKKVMSDGIKLLEYKMTLK